MAELIAASEEGDEVEAKILLDQELMSTLEINGRGTPLHKAKNAAIVRLLLDHGANVNARNAWQGTPLHKAKNEAIAKLLLDHGADVNARNNERQTPFDVAENEAIAKLLLDHGADVNARASGQRTPLHDAKSVAIAKLLLDHGADVNARDGAQRTPLHLAQNGAMVKLLLDHGADVNARTSGQRTPLHDAKSVAIAKLLLDHGADVNARDGAQGTPLHYQLANDNAMARLLVNRGAQLTAVYKDGLNALHRAALYANLDLCLFFVSRGLDPNIKFVRQSNITDSEDETALTLYGRKDGLNDDDEEKQEAVVQLLAAREAYFQRVRDEHWKKNWPLLNTLTSSGLRPMAVEMAALALEQASLDTSVSLPGIPRDTPAKNIAYLNRAVFGHEGFLREIVSFIPRARFEVGEEEEEEEKEEEEEDV